MIKKIIFFIIMIVIYLILINFVSFTLFNYNLDSKNIFQENIDNEIGKVNFNDNVDIFVKRNKLYGSINEKISDKNNLSILTILFGFVNIPLNVNHFSLVWIHLLFLFLLFFIFLKGGR